MIDCDKVCPRHKNAPLSVEVFQSRFNEARLQYGVRKLHETTFSKHLFRELSPMQELILESEIHNGDLSCKMCMFPGKVEK